MTALIYHCENYLSPPLDTPLYNLYTTYFRSIGGEMKENLFCFFSEKHNKWPKCVAEIFAFKDID